jgi:4-hydroxythreonine-4-phosphate dehydrogenase
MGDAAGIGPELVVKVLNDKDTYEICNPLVIGEPKVIDDISHRIGAGIKARSIQKIDQVSFSLYSTPV